MFVRLWVFLVSFLQAQIVVWGSFDHDAEAPSLSSCSEAVQQEDASPTSRKRKAQDVLSQYASEDQVFKRLTDAFREERDLGLKEGMAQGVEKIAQKLLSQNLNIDLILKVTG